jgi:hypothetical protein
LYSAEVNHPFKLELLIAGAVADLKDKSARAYEYPKAMFPLESVCAFAAAAKNTKTNPNTILLRMAEHSLP